MSALRRKVVRDLYLAVSLDYSNEKICGVDNSFENTEIRNFYLDTAHK